MKTINYLCAFLMLVFLGISTMQAKNALVIIAHGAPDAQWNSPVLNLEKNVNNVIISRGIKGIDYVRVALMEFSRPTVSEVIDDCERQQIDHIFIIPLFITESSHSEEDIPNILGLKYSPETTESLEKEGTSLVNTSIPITIGTTLSYGSVIEEIILDRVKSLSADSSKETLLLVAHGDPDYISWWNRLADKAGRYVQKQTGMEYAGAVFAGMGQSLFNDLQPKLKLASNSGKRIIIQGIYLSTGLAQMAKMDGRMNNPNIVFSPYGLLPEDENARISNWIADRANEWVSKTQKSSNK